MLAMGLFTFVVIAPKSAVMKVSNCKAPSLCCATHFDRASASRFSRQEVSPPTAWKRFSERCLHREEYTIALSYSLNRLKSARYDVTPIKSLDRSKPFSLLAFVRAHRNVSKSAVQFLFRIWFVFVCLNLSLLTSLPPSTSHSKTSSDNLGDAIQFLREFDHEAAEMCNR